MRTYLLIFLLTLFFCAALTSHAEAGKIPSVSEIVSKLPGGKSAVKLHRKAVRKTRKVLKKGFNKAVNSTRKAGKKWQKFNNEQLEKGKNPALYNKSKNKSKWRQNK